MTIEAGMTIRVPAGASLTRKRTYVMRVTELLTTEPNEYGHQYVRGELYRNDGRPQRGITCTDFIQVEKVELS
jgi:hypothetical protein